MRAPSSLTVPPFARPTSFEAGLALGRLLSFSVQTLPLPDARMSGLPLPGDFAILPTADRLAAFHRASLAARFPRWQRTAPGKCLLPVCDSW